MRSKLNHVSRSDHQELARLLNQAQDNLQAATGLVGRAAFTDEALRVMKAVQEKLIDPLRAAWEARTDDDPDNPYQSIGY